MKRKARRAIQLFFSPNNDLVEKHGGDAHKAAQSLIDALRQQAQKEIRNQAPNWRVLNHHPTKRGNRWCAGVIVQPAVDSTEASNHLQEVVALVQQIASEHGGESVAVGD